MNIVLVSIGIALCILASAFFSGSEMALSSCNPVRLENEAKSGKKASKRALKLSENFDDSLGAILVGNNLMNTAASALTTVLVILLTGSDKLNWAGTLIVTVLVIILGEAIPKIVCKKHSNQAAAACSGIIQFLIYLFKPVNLIFVGIVNLITRGIKEEQEDEEEAVEELQSMIETAEDEGVLDSERSELVTAAIDFPDISVEEAMTSRVDMQAIDIDDERSQILKLVMDSSHSRLPVFRESIDNIIGVVHLNHLLKALAEDENADIEPILMPACYVYRTMKLPVVMDIMKAARQHLAIVTDEYSGTLGVVSMEDLLEEIVGEIWDETDTVEEEVIREDDGAAVVDGDMNIDDFRELLGLDDEVFDFDSNTAGGFAIEYLGRFPEEGETFEYEGIKIEITKMDERRVEKLRVTLPPAGEEENETR